MSVLFGSLCAIPMVLIVILLAVVVPLQIKAEQDRLERFSRWAAAQGWTMRKAPHAPWTARLPGRSRRGLGVTFTARIDGHWVTVAEYSYETTDSSGENTTTSRHWFVVVLIQLDRGYPAIAVGPRGVFSQWGRSLFGDKPTATGNELFDARFKITAADPVAAKAVVTPAVVRAYLGGPLPAWSLVGNELLTYRKVSGKLTDPNQVPAHAAPLLHIANLLGRW
ncbi:hypothetical protein LTV02_06105 [Nocardia yamanashiensis]|uniref:hypothetical protein n=1 Tax=Nocardia yamanashiensis TaxID=209247 RepID=UPI001E4DB503|nr:hypothetical protein [Nocardia yamanashiensis]UGT42966.1 hypothetical protein LTV02_06105 [Nocardia yamanashiensis]